MKDCPFSLIQLCAGGDVGVYHQQVELLRFVILVDAAENAPVGAGAVVQGELDKLLGLFLF